MFGEIRLLGPFKALNNKNQLFFYPKLWYPEAWGPVVYSISLLSCMVKYKDASKDQNSLITLNTVFLDTLYIRCHLLTTTTVG